MPRDRKDRAALPPGTRSGEQERHLAVSALAQQIAQLVAVLSMLAAITVLARRLSLPEFGTYGLLLSLTSYVLFVQGAVETPAVKSIAEALDQPARDRAFSTAMSLYVFAGLISGVVMAAAGTAVLQLIDSPDELHHHAQISVLALAAITAVGWPLKVFQDVLRGAEHFVASSAAEGTAVFLVGIALVTLGLRDAPLWLLVSTGAAIPFATGALSAGFVRSLRLPYHYARETVTNDSVRGFLGLSAYVLVGGVAELVIYSLDSVILATFRSTAAVGLYQGPVRAHNFVLQVQSALVTPVLSVSSRYLAENDVHRTRDLLLRGTRYTLAAVVPLTIVLMTLAEPILKVWLGPKFQVAAPAMTVLVGYWLINAGTGVPGRMLIAAGKARILAFYAVAVAVANLALSLALTPSLGLNGVVLGTTISYLLGFPFFIRIVLSTFPVTLKDLAREVWLPAYSTGGVAAVGLLLVRVSVPLDTVLSVVGVGLLAILSYWAIYYLIWLSPGERVLVTNIVRTALRR